MTIFDWIEKNILGLPDEPKRKIVQRGIVHVKPTNIKRRPAYNLSSEKDKTIIKLSEKQLLNLFTKGECINRGIKIIGTFTINNDEHLKQIAKILMSLDNIETILRAEGRIK